MRLSSSPFGYQIISWNIIVEYQRGNLKGDSKVLFDLIFVTSVKSTLKCHFDLWEKSAVVCRFPARRSHSGGLIFVPQVANDRFLINSS